jgi:leucyl-tRNA synthetase
VHTSSWPKYQKDFLVTESVTIAVQINGKLRDTVELNKNSTQKEAEDMALLSPKIKDSLGGRTPKKIIFVPGKIINIVA